MRYLTATEARQKFAAVLDAVQRGPIVIREDSCDLAVLISAWEYRRLRGVIVVDFQAFCDRVGNEAVAKGLTQCKLAALLR